jgi:hypothetical protein
MKISKARLKQIIKEELENLEEYSPYKTGARPDKPHKKPGETKDDGKYADPKRARPKKRYEEQEELEEDEEEVINEELTRQDKTDVKEIVKKIMKKLYKDLSLEHPYIIDRIKI